MEIDTKEFDKRIAEVSKWLSDWNEHMASLKTEEEKAAFLKETYNEFNLKCKESDELFNKRFEIMHNEYVKMEAENKLTKYDDSFDKEVKVKEEKIKNTKEKIDTLLKRIDESLAKYDSSNNLNISRNYLKESFNQFTKDINRDNPNILSIKNYFVGLLNTMKKGNTKVDSRFIPYGRMLYLKEDLDKKINNSEYIDAIFDFGDYLDEARIQGATGNLDKSVVDNNLEYFREDKICAEEKEILINMAENIYNKAKMDYFKYVFAKDLNGAYVRLVIPASFVKTIIPSKNEPVSYIGKKDLDLNSEEVPLLKLYARALKEDNID